MDALAVPFGIACVLLAAGGALKAWDPAPTAGALRGVGWRVPSALVRVGGGAEAVLAAFALLTGNTVAAALVGVSYLAFAGFVLVALRQDVPVGSCGCLGTAETPPSVLHVVLDVALGVTALAVATGADRGIGTVLTDSPLAGIGIVILIATGTGAAFALLTALPRALDAAALSAEQRATARPGTR